MSYLSSKSVYKSPIKRFEFCFAIVGLLFYAGGLTNILTTSGLHTYATPIRYALMAGAIYGSCLSPEKTLSAIRNGRWIWPLTFLTIASFTWAANSAIAIQSIRSDFIPITLFGLYFSIRFSPKEIFHILFVSTLLMSLASLFYAIAIPSIGKHPASDAAYGGSWRGIFIHKNGLGLNLTINCVLVGLKLLYENKNLFHRNLAIYLFLSTEIILSKSLSSLIFSNTIIVILWIYKRFNWKGRLSVLILYWLSLLIVGTAGFISVLWVPIMNALGKDPTLSARTLIWDYILNRYVAQKPFLGYGRGSLWHDGEFNAGLWKATSHVPPHAHNGYVDLIFALGYIGLLFFIFSLLSTGIKSLKLAYHTNKKEEVLPLALILILLIFNITESVLLRGASIMWLLYLAISCAHLNKEK